MEDNEPQKDTKDDDIPKSTKNSSPTKNQQSTEEVGDNNNPEVPEPILNFKCELCNLNETYHYFGKSPPWSTKTALLEEAYISKDPFSMPQKKQILILGSKCSMCYIDVCVGTKCSLFFSKRFCKHCAFKNITYFPSQIQMKINKHFGKWQVECVVEALFVVSALVMKINKHFGQ
uniref:Cysteine-rich DPF motif domain-containing protein 1 n=1 Tax=Cacopsylla melanoneura TaxID=428564 RepID=A0A8D8TGG8_9HEMI